MSEKKKFWLGALAGAAGMLIIVSIIKSIKSFIAVLLIFCMLFLSTDPTCYSTEDYNFIDDGSGTISTTPSSKADEIRALLEKYYLYEIDEQAVEDAELAGMINGLNDPYSAYYSYDDIIYQEENAETEYTGVGMEVIQNYKDHSMVIFKIFKDSPAEAAGIQVGDFIISVNGENVEGKDLNDVVSMILGEPGTPVTIGIKRESEELEFTVNRATIDTTAVRYEKKDDEIGYISYYEFTEESIEQMKAALAQADADHVKGLIIDLRNNPGGTVNSAISVSDMFIKTGDVIMTTSDKNNVVTAFTSDNAPLFLGSVVVLVNGNTASAAEIFAAALREDAGAKIVGTQTYGKGVVQTLHELSDGTYIKITTEYYYTPSGTCINGVGLTPDLVVDPVDGSDAQYDAAVNAIKEMFIPK